MNIKEALYRYLVNHPQVGPAVQGRVYPVHLPQAPGSPSIAFQKLNSPRDHTHDGPSGLAWPRFGLVMMATTPTAAEELAAKVRLALDGFAGTMPGGSGEQVAVDGIFLDDEGEDGYDDELGLYWVSHEYEIWHHE